MFAFMRLEGSGEIDCNDLISARTTNRNPKKCADPGIR